MGPTLSRTEHKRHVQARKEMTLPYRVAVIGLGRIGAQLERDPLRQRPSTHLGAWVAHKDRCEVVGICDNALPFTDMGIEGVSMRTLTIDETRKIFYTDYQKMLTDVKADIVSVATPDETHRKIARDVMGY